MTPQEREAWKELVNVALGISVYKGARITGDTILAADAYIKRLEEHRQQLIDLEVRLNEIMDEQKERIKQLWDAIEWAVSYSNSDGTGPSDWIRFTDELRRRAKGE